MSWVHNGQSSGDLAALLMQLLNSNILKQQVWIRHIAYLRYHRLSQQPYSQRMMTPDNQLPSWVRNCPATMQHLPLLRLIDLLHK